ncbi:hypothetical protein [Nocardioides bizhenqiangii]|uniref:Uncharacterized protein n=1 Tax=Nocardioides bizhenqiangii TaxID=3095076 RepID=A0ABZ0ZRC9_9ACTN|nr:hypothetical protein [Nocardioides sp. HM61]WQQ26326.1 hypothetical protein SHK19_20490 [Nocardioides sp. HM61]
MSVQAVWQGLYLPVALAGVIKGEVTEEYVVGAPLLWCYYFVFAAVVALPLALVGVPVIHLVCRHHASQVVHVVVTGLVSFALVFVVLGLMLAAGGGRDLLPFFTAAAAVVAAATMVGRASVIPLVRRRQRPARGLYDFERSNSPRCALGRS